MIKITKCPYCNKEYKNVGGHILKCNSISENINQNERKLIWLKYKVGYDFIEDFINDYKNNFSFTDLKNKYRISLKSIGWILEQNNIHIRNYSEAFYATTKEKIHNTLKEKYGENIINVGQLESTKEKVKQTSLKKWGYTNIWKTPEYAKFTSERWSKMDTETRNRIIKAWTSQNRSISKLEIKILKVFNDLNIPIQTQFSFDDFNHKYDIYILGTNIIVEVNGDYWHANPQKYNQDDIIKYPKMSRRAKDVWENDKNNIKIAENKGYKVITLWENDINSSNDLNLFVANSIFPYIN